MDTKQILRLWAPLLVLLGGLIALSLYSWFLYREIAKQQHQTQLLQDQDRQLFESIVGLQSSLEEAQKLLDQTGTTQTELNDKLAKSLERIQELYFDLLSENDGMDEIWSSPDPGKTAYLTFDDGPSSHTQTILEILKEHKAKASFFVNGRPSFANTYRSIVDQGHTLGLHGFSHEYENIYSSVAAFVSDMEKLEALLGNIKVPYKKIYRFPGGAKNSFALRLGGPDLTARISVAMAERGFYFYEWNVTSGDAEAGVNGSMLSAAQLTERTLREAKNKRIALIILHDGPGHQELVKALPSIIKGLRALGFTIKALPKAN